MYAIIEDRTSQYKVSEGDEVLIDRSPEEVKKSLEFKVLLLGDGKNTKVGAPYVDGASVSATVVDHLKDDKIYVRKYKRKTGYHKKTGHRQPVTLIKIEKISA